MLISGNEPSSVILSQTKTFKKLESDAQLAKVPKEVQAKRDGVINPIRFNVEPYLGFECWFGGGIEFSTFDDVRLYVTVTLSSMWMSFL